MPNRNVSILEEITEQGLDAVSAGSDMEPNSTILTPTPIASPFMGNNGWQCTLTAECQNNCN